MDITSGTQLNKNEKGIINIPTKFDKLDIAENLAALMVNLNSFVEELDAKMRSMNGKLISRAYQRFLQINSEALEIIAKVRKGESSIKPLMDLLEKNIRFIAIYEKDFAKRVISYKSSLEKVPQFFSRVKSISDTNIDSKVLESIIRHQDVPFRVKSRLVLLKNMIDEVSTLIKCLEDLGEKGKHLDTLKFKERIEGYFTGITENNNQIGPLDRFKDEKLKQIVMQSNEFKMLSNLALFTHKIQAQRTFVETIVKFIKQDLNEKTGVWERNLSTQTFFSGIDDYSKKFEKYFQNRIFAKWITQSKDKLGEQPFEWIKLFGHMEKSLDDSSPKVLAAIDNARNLVHFVFEQRIADLKSKINIVVKNIGLGLEEGIDSLSFIKEVEHGLKNMEEKISKNENQRGKRFKKLKKKITALNISVYEPIKPIIYESDVSGNVSRVESNLIELKNLASLIGNEFSFGGLFKSGIAAAKSEASSKVIMEESVSGVNKAKRIGEFDLKKIKSIKELILVYMELIRFSTSIGLEFNKESLIQKLSQIYRFCKMLDLDLVRQIQFTNFVMGENYE